MAKRKRSLSSDTSSPAFIHPIRSSTRQSLNLNTTVAKEHLTRDWSTPTTDNTSRSVDFQDSPASSRTSSNLIEAVLTSTSSSDTTARSKSNITKRFQAKNATVSPVASKESTSGGSDRSGRRRKPTQKAAELAANSSSKLFKTGGNGQIQDDNTLSTEEDLQLDIEHGLSKNDVPELLPASDLGKCSDKASRKVDVEILPGNEAMVKQEAEHLVRPVIERDSLEQPKSRTSKCKPRQRPQPLEEALASKGRSISKRITGSNGNPAAVDINIISSETSLPSGPTKSSTNHVPSSSNAPAGYSLPSKVTTTSEPSKKLSPIQILPTKRPPNTITRLNPPKPILESLPTQPPLPTTSKPTRIKFKPLQTSISSALAGYTSLPCDLSCLPESDLFYIWAKLAVEREDIVEELCALEQEFDGDDGFHGVKGRVVRGKLNAFLLRFCVCEKNTNGVACGSGSGSGNGNANVDRRKRKSKSGEGR